MAPRRNRNFDLAVWGGSTVGKRWLLREPAG